MPGGRRAAPGSGAPAGGRAAPWWAVAALVGATGGAAADGTRPEPGRVPDLDRSAPVETAVRSDYVRILQRHLNRIGAAHGFHAGEEDGEEGPQTRAALARAAVLYGLDVAGRDPLMVIDWLEAIAVAMPHRPGLTRRGQRRPGAAALGIGAEDGLAPRASFEDAVAAALAGHFAEDPPAVAVIVPDEAAPLGRILRLGRYDGRTFVEIAAAGPEDDWVALAALEQRAPGATAAALERALAERFGAPQLRLEAAGSIRLGWFAAMPPGEAAAACLAAVRAVPARGYAVSTPASRPVSATMVGTDVAALGCGAFRLADLAPARPDGEDATLRLVAVDPAMLTGPAAGGGAQSARSSRIMISE